MRVGPQSAGAEPGPVCYGHGGEQPTVTDANLVLGLLDADSLLGGGLPVDLDRAESAVQSLLGKPLGLDARAAAAGVIDIVNNAMAEALRTVSVERGHDPREFSLIAFGGAGPLHAVSLAEELDIGEVIIPPVPGVFSALGLVGTDVKRDYARTWFHSLDEADPNEIESVYSQMEASADAMLERAGIPNERREFARSADMRYPRQAYELNVPSPPEPVTRDTLTRSAGAFHDKHEQTYGHANRDERVQIVTLRVTALGRLDALSLSHQGSDGQSEKSSRRVWFRDHGEVTCPVHDRDRLALGQRLEGPVIVESLDSTVNLPPGWRLEVRDGGSFTLSPRSAVRGELDV